MNILTAIFVWLVAIEALGFMVLEIFGNDKSLAAAFNLKNTYLQQPEARIALSNQGIYNGFIDCSLLFSYFVSSYKCAKKFLPVIYRFYRLSCYLGEH